MNPGQNSLSNKFVAWLFKTLSTMVTVIAPTSMTYCQNIVTSQNSKNLQNIVESKVRKVITNGSTFWKDHEEHRDGSKFKESHHEHRDGSKFWKGHEEHRDGSKFKESHHEYRDGSKFRKVVPKIAIGEQGTDEGQDLQ